LSIFKIKKGADMGNAEKAAVKRFGRNVIGLGIAELIALAAGQPWFIAFGPAINALAKWIRDKFKIPNIPI
jgi:hypothetical protein